MLCVIMIDKKNVYAVVGASSNNDKFWYKVFKDLLDWWYNVIPINPNEKHILWEKVYPTLSSVDWKIDVVIFVVPPSVTQTVLLEVKKLWIKNVWMQPWSENDAAISFCHKEWINVVANSCIMIQKNSLPQQVI